MTGSLNEGPAYDASLLDFLASQHVPARPSFADLSPEAARDASASFLSSFSPGPGVAATDVTVESTRAVRVRVYRPSGRPVAVVVYLHGGGWVLGGVESSEHVARALTEAFDAVLVSVDYRLAPEHPYPAALEDVWEALQWAASCPEVTADRLPLLVFGDSAGGNLAAIVARRARDARLPIKAQVLVYPVIDRRFDTPSYAQFAEGYGLSRREMEWFWFHYAPDGDPADPDLVPLAASDLHGVAPAIVVTAEYDVLASEGQSYARALEDAGIEVDCSVARGLPHGFLSFVNDVKAVGAVVEGIVTTVRQWCSSAADPSEG